MAYSRAQNIATQKYIKNNYDEIKIRVPKGRKSFYQQYAIKSGFSLNAYIVSALEKECKSSSLDSVDISPVSRVRQVLATMAIEDMYFSSEFVNEMVKAANGELSTEQVREMVLEKYVR